jgi:hypothetical protein
MTDLQPAASSGAPEQTLVIVGDIVVSRSWVVTPSGAIPIRGTQFLLADFSRSENRIPPWAIVLAVLGALFTALLSLLFLLAKETVTTGTVQVTVTNDRTTHTVAIPVNSHAAVVDIYNRVNYARQLVAAAV